MSADHPWVRANHVHNPTVTSVRGDRHLLLKFRSTDDRDAWMRCEDDLLSDPESSGRTGVVLIDMAEVVDAQWRPKNGDHVLLNGRRYEVEGRSLCGTDVYALVGVDDEEESFLAHISALSPADALTMHPTSSPPPT